MPDVVIVAAAATDGACVATAPVAAADVVVMGVTDDVPGTGTASSGACATSAASTAAANVVPGAAADDVALDIRVRPES